MSWAGLCGRGKVGGLASERKFDAIFIGDWLRKIQFSSTHRGLREGAVRLLVRGSLAAASGQLRSGTKGNLTFPYSGVISNRRSCVCVCVTVRVRY